jgi:hypothetical protein
MEASVSVETTTRYVYLISSHVGNVMGAGISFGNMKTYMPDPPPLLFFLQYPNEKKADSECNYPCESAGAEGMCGGYWRNSVYESTSYVEPEPAAYAYKGCFVDKSVRAFEYLASMHLGSIEECAQVCMVQHGYKYAALQHGSECFCGYSNKVSNVDQGCFLLPGACIL